jgi:acetyltransferase
VILDATAVAVIGASDDPAKVGGSVLANLVAGGFEGRIVPVNARSRVVQGLAAVPSIRDVPDHVDVAVIAVPASAVLSVLKDCVAAGVGAAVVISAGFGETGREGRAREAELRTWLVNEPIRVLGPNCLGWMRPPRKLNLSFAPGLPRAGGIGFFSQSGALCTAILDWSRDHGTGFSLFASLGNQVDITESDVLDALATDAETRVILGYLEGVSNGRRFFESLRAAAATKPCVLLKAGRTPEGARAVSSHTGALAGSDAAFDSAVRQAGALRAHSVEELFDLARALATQPLPSGRRAVIVTNGGGLGILATDAARDAGLELPPVDEAVRAALARALPPHAALANPIDLIGDATAARYDTALRALRGEAGALLVMLSPQAATDSAGVARTIVSATRGRSEPVLGVFAGGAHVRAGVQVLEEGGVPVYQFPERAVRALAGMATLAERRRSRSAVRAAPAASAAAVIEVARPAGAREQIGLLRAAPWLEAYGIRCARTILAATPEAARAAAARLGGPVAVKIVSRAISHKTDVGGVRVGLRSPAEVAEATVAILGAVAAARPEAHLDGVLVQEMAEPGGFELLLGMVRDPQFGPLVMVGFGGIYVEVLGDTATRLAPVDRSEAAAMVADLRMAPALRGARGRPAADVDALAETIARFSELAMAVPALQELEINPLIVGPHGALAIDVRGAIA